MNGKVDGTSYFVEALMENTAAASALLSKLIPPEQPPEKVTGLGVSIHVHSVAEGQMFLPGNEVLAPFDFAGEVWAAYNAGPEWKPYLETVKGRFTLESFEKLSSVPPLERKTFLPDEAPTLRLVPRAPAVLDEAQLEARLATLESDLSGLSRAQLLERASRILEIINPDDDHAA